MTVFLSQGPDGYRYRYQDREGVICHRSLAALFHSYGYWIDPLPTTGEPLSPEVQARLWELSEATLPPPRPLLPPTALEPLRLVETALRAAQGWDSQDNPEGRGGRHNDPFWSQLQSYQRGEAAQQHPAWNAIASLPVAGTTIAQLVTQLMSGPVSPALAQSWEAGVRRYGEVLRVTSLSSAGASLFRFEPEFHQ
jgi:hypothetical protein